MNITLQNLTKRFPTRGKRAHGEMTAVQDLSFEVPDGMLVGLLGPSGCGKTTTLNMICGLEKPSSGRILFGQEDVTALPPELRGVGMVFQNYALYPHLTVLQNILFPLENLKGAERPSRQEMRRRALEVAQLVQIEPLLDRKPKELSGGQQQRVAIARALVKMPRVLLLDEPLSNLDARLRLQTREEICKIQKKTGITTLFVTHDQEEAMSISDRIVVMKDGILMQQGRPQQVYDDPANLFVAKFLGTPPINVFAACVRDEMLCLAGQPALPVRGVKDQDVWAGVRPEGFLPEPEGPVVCSLDRVEVLGRDVSIVCAHPACQAGTLRAIINSQHEVSSDARTVSFSLRPDKVFLFQRESEQRISFHTDLRTSLGQG